MRLSYKSPTRGMLFHLMLLCVALFLLGGLLCWMALSQANNGSYAQDQVRFAHLSDVHYNTLGTDKSWRLLKDSPVLLEAALKGIHQEPNLDFLLFTGDTVDGPQPANFEGFFGMLHRGNRRPVYMVLGNHDVGVKPALNKQYTIDAFRRYGGPEMFPSTNRSYYSVSPEPWLRLLVLDGTTDEKVSANGFIPQAELDWVKGQLAEAEKSHQMVIAAAHFPVVEPFHSSSHMIVKPDADKLRALLEGSPNFVAYFAGHYHSARIQQYNRVYHITSPALVEYPDAYRVVTLTRDGHLSLAWHPTPLTTLSAKSKSRSPFWQTAQGNPQKDHELKHGVLRYHP
jgi:predicted MPP superfamily phosphohydrolase